MRRSAIVFGYVVLAMGAGCDGGADSTPAPAVGAKTANADTVAPATLSIGGNDYCFVGTDKYKKIKTCDHVLPAKWSDMGVADLYHAVSNVGGWSGKSTGVPRHKTSTQCTGSLSIATQTPKDTRKMHPDPRRWEPGVSFVAARFIDETHSAYCKDAKYQVGGDGTNKAEYYLVATLTASAARSRTADEQIGTWMVLGFSDKAAGKVDTASTGKFVECGHPHFPEDDAVSGFTTCGLKYQLIVAAAANNMTPAAMRALLDKARASGGQIGIQTLSTFAKLFLDGEDDAPVWITCALGCCTAESPGWPTN